MEFPINQDYFILKEGDERTLELKSFGRMSDALLEALCKAAKK